MFCLKRAILLDLCWSFLNPLISTFTSLRCRDFCPTDVCPTDICPTDICPTWHLSNHDVCPSTLFVRHIHNMRHLSDLNITCVICPTRHLSDIFQNDRTDIEGMGAGVWGWNPQLGDESLPVRLGRSGKGFFYLFFLQKLKLSLTSKPCIQSPFWQWIWTCTEQKKGQMDGRTDGQTDEQTDGQVGRQTF